MPDAITVLTAINGPDEASLVAGMEREPAVVVVHRCADLAELLAAAAAGRARAALVSADLRRLDRDAVGRLTAAGVAVVAVGAPRDLDVVTPGRPLSTGEVRSRLARLGVTTVLEAGASSVDVAAALAAAVRELDDLAGRRSGTADPRLGVADPAAALRDAPRSAAGAGPTGRRSPMAGTGRPWPADTCETTAGLPPADGPTARPGRLVAVWGPQGAPGRTTVAVTVAAELARAGEEVLLADADSYGASVAQVLGLLDESPGLAAAVRAAVDGRLDLDLLARTALVALPGLRVLGGVARSDRWPELRPAGLDVVWQQARHLASWVVVDCGFCLEADEEITFDTAAPRRNGSTLATLAAADHVLAVGSADPVGLQRLVRALTELAEAVPAVQPRVVVNRVRASAVGSNPGDRVRDALVRYAGVHRPLLVPYDRDGCDRALLDGRALTEAVPHSPARRALAGLAADLIAEDPGARPARRGSARGGSARGGSALGWAAWGRRTPREPSGPSAAVGA